MKRDASWDSLKFILIFIVIYGHMIETFAADGTFVRAMYNFIYLFHMPLFVFVSGMFSHVREPRPYLKKMLLLFESYAVFQIIKCAKPLLMGTSLHLWPDILLPKGTLWYLACLLLWRLLVVACGEQRLSRHWVLVLILSFASGLGIGFLPITDGTLTRFFALSPFFFMGYYSAAADLKGILRRIPLSVAAILLPLLFLVVYLFFNFDISYAIYFVHYGFSDTIPSAHLLLCRLGVYCAAMIISIVFMRIVLSQSAFAQYGGLTLPIFLYHTFIVLALRPVIERGAIPGNGWALLAYAVAICAVLVVAIRYVKLFTIALNPVSRLLSK